MSGEKKLNKEQISAIEHGNGPLLVIAGAGTGKTTVITERVKWIITQNLAKTDEVLALTFTEKAAQEMEERIDQALPMGFTQTWIMTFHSFCDRVLRDEGIHIGLSSNFRLLTETDLTSLVSRHLFELSLNYFRPLGNPNKFIGSLLQHFSRLQDEDISPSEYLSWATQNPDLKSDDPAIKMDAEKYLELAQVYSQLSQIKAKESVLDFADLISYTLHLFRTRPNLLKTYQSKFKYLLVDEFQDTNYAQNQLVLLLAGEKPNLTVVADDDQSVYRWRGAAVSNVIQFRHTFPDSKLVVLTHNYRSTQEILDRSYDLIQFNNPDRLEIKENIDKRLIADRKIAGSPVKFLHFDRVENEADAVVLEIDRLINSTSSSLSPKDIAILVRANSHAEPFIRSLTRRGIPFQFLGPGQLFQQPEIKDLIAYLKLLFNPDDDPAFYRLLSQDFFSFSAREVANLANFAHRYTVSLYVAAEILTLKKTLPSITLPEFSSEFVTGLSNIVDLISSHLAQVSKTTAGQILFSFLKESGMLKYIIDYRDPFTEKSVANIMKFFDKLKSFEATNVDASVSAVIDWIDLASEVGESPAATEVDWIHNDCVNILTVHSAKGLEFPVVFLVNMVSQRFPSVERKEPIPIPPSLVREVLPEGDYHLQEERRLFYVGMTRAKDQLFITAADFYGEGKRIKKLSPFITQALGEAAILPASAAPAGQLSILDWANSSKTVPSVSPHQVKVDYLSYSQIQTFVDCPLHYKAKYLLKIPSPPHAASSFGNTIHQTLREYFTSQTRGESPDIVQIYTRNWIPEGFVHKKQQDEYFSLGLDYLHTYLSQAADATRLPTSLELPFIVSLGSLSIGGKIDRVDQLPNGKIEIIDYKTSTKSLTQKEADQDLQLSFYALAANLLPNFPYSHQPEDLILSLYYFSDQKKVSTTRTRAQLEKAKVEILSYADEISHSNFKCSGGIVCKKCDFKMLCDLDQVDS